MPELGRWFKFILVLNLKNLIKVINYFKLINSDTDKNFFKLFQIVKILKYLK